MEAPGKPVVFTLTDNSVTLVQTGSTSLRTCHIHNPDATLAFVQFFNAAAAEDVTGGTTIPDLSVQIAAVGDYDLPLPAPWAFPLGLCVMASTGARTSADTGSDMHIYATIASY